MIFAKIFNVNEGKSQVVVTKEYDHEEEAFTLRLRSDIPVASIAITAGYDDEQHRDSVFDKFNQAMADEFYTDNVSRVAQMAEGEG